MGEQQSTWIIAVSGGVDSIVLLDILARHSQARLVVAHIDHGIRDDGQKDLKLVQKHATTRNLHMEYTKLDLGTSCSEEKAREARYTRLNQLAQQYGAQYVVTAHHQDDVLETMIINHLRGTGWRGLASLRSHGLLYRPLLHMSKARIVAYALHHGLVWRDDSTNEDMRYLRNAIRASVVPRLSPHHRHQLIRLHEAQLQLADQIDEECQQLKVKVGHGEGVSRYWLSMVPGNVAAVMLESLCGQHLQRPHQRQLVHFARSARSGAILELPNGLRARVTTDELFVSSLSN